MRTEALPAVALAEAHRVRDGVTSELDLLLGDLAAWVNTDTPGGDVSAVDRLAASMAHTLEGYGLARGARARR